MSCSAGNPGATASPGATVGLYGGGTYQDPYGDYWEVDCGYLFNSTTYYEYPLPGTRSQGMYACFNGCAARPNCVAFNFYGYQTGPHSGGGLC